jgi:predicted O-methyltransferase YrrM
VSKAASWSFAEDFLEEDDLVLGARARAAGLGCRAVSAGTGALLRALAGTLPVRSAVEVGTGAGVSGLYLMAGLPEAAVLTTIDIEAEHQALARAAFAEAGHRANRTRSIVGDAVDVLPRLAEGSYELAVVDVDPAESALQVCRLVIPLLRDRGLLVVVGAMHGDRVPDPTRRDPGTVAARELLDLVAAGGRFHVSLIPTGDGVLLAGRRPV